MKSLQCQSKGLSAAVNVLAHIGGPVLEYVRLKNPPKFVDSKPEVLLWLKRN